MSPINRVTDLIDDVPTSFVAASSSAPQHVNGFSERQQDAAAGNAKSESDVPGLDVLGTSCGRPGGDSRYSLIQRELFDELRPETFTDKAMVDSLALDYVHLEALARNIQALLTPPPLPAHDAAVLEEISAARRGLCDIRKMLGRGRRDDGERDDGNRAHRGHDRVKDPADGGGNADGDGQRPIGPCGRPAAERLADLIVRLVEGIMADLAQARADGEVEADMAEPERREFKWLKAMGKMIRPARRELADRDRVAAVLSGEVAAPIEQLQRLYELLFELEESLSFFIKGKRDVERTILRRLEEAAAAARDPARLDRVERLQRQRREVDKSITLKLHAVRHLTPTCLGAPRGARQPRRG